MSMDSNQHHEQLSHYQFLRGLQHATLGLDKNPADFDEDPNDPASTYSFLFPIVISIGMGIGCIWILCQYVWVWICKEYFGYVYEEPLTGEEILANLTEDQRRAVFQTILSKEVVYEHPAKTVKGSTKGHSVVAPVTVVKDVPVPKRQHRDSLASHPTNDDDEKDAALSSKVPISSTTISLQGGKDKGSFAASSTSLCSRNESGREDAEDGSSDEGGFTKRQFNFDPTVLVDDDIMTIADLDVNSKEEEEVIDIEKAITDDDDTKLIKDQGVAEKQEELVCLPIVPRVVAAAARRRSSTATAMSKKDSSVLGEEDEEEDRDREHECPICLGGYAEENMLIVSNHCTHMFHIDCILEWLTTNKHDECPICRVKMVTQEEMLAAAMVLVEKTKAAASAEEKRKK